MTVEPHHIDEEDAERVWLWLMTRGGLALWKSVDVNDLDKTWTCPLKDETGLSKPKPSWQSADEPYRVITDRDGVVVRTRKEVERFHVSNRRGGNGYVLTDASDKKLRDALERAGDYSSYAFDYLTEEAVVFAVAGEIPIKTWADERGLTPQYKHDCDLCRFLGRFAYDAPYGEVVKPLSVDLYVCREQGLDYATFLARRGDESSAYSSYDKGTLERSGLLTNARTTYSPGVVEAYRRFMQEKNA